MATKKRRSRRKVSRRRRSGSYMGFEGTRRRRRSGRRMHGAAGVGRGGMQAVIVQAWSILGGALVAAIAGPKLPLPEKVRPVAPAAAGLLLAVTKLGRNPLIRGAGIGMLVTGGLSMLRTWQPKLPMLGAATEEEELIGIPAVSGEELIGIPAVSGDDDEVEGDDDEGYAAAGVPAIAGAGGRAFMTSADF